MNKINVMSVIKKHYTTMSDQRGNILLEDIAIHFIIPLTLSLIICFTYGIMKTSIASVFVNFGAITTALLMSAVIMIYDQKQKTVFKISDIEENNKPRSNLIILNNNKTVYEQLCHNVSYAILTSVALVIFSVAIYFLPETPSELKKWYFATPAYIISYLAYSSFFFTVVTFLMVIKRFSTILDS
ncbi:hypothetical protein BON67_04480 [Escherichia coli]|jgi:hypothetical protein|uniref:Uncharacterized protein n=3 Tax=Escherichia coli TaxID=562 RepID=A0AAD2NVI4_ECOLX|nr:MULTISPECIES: hypothetical protein [Enterobacteriaceae]EFA5373669.1 hypothetical protein [Escherichia coli O53]EFA5392390.1 hypothetical protein [Escherichia coli O6]EFA8247190.1 hypothetical protein [Escherichia coli O157]EKD0896133.1 hypothetical protein [Shigella sonnei]MED9033816.1 hypothetical protein [Escherichia marmotae]